MIEIGLHQVAWIELAVMDTRRRRRGSDLSADTDFAGGTLACQDEDDRSGIGLPGSGYPVICLNSFAGGTL